MEEPVQVYKGEMGLNDAVFNYPKAFRLSKKRYEKGFWFNAGLSVANLLVRAVGDVQALLNPHMTGLPDRDGRCESLPARFSLFLAYDDLYSNSRTSAIGKGRVTDEDVLLKSDKQGTETPSYLSGETPSYLSGEALSRHCGDARLRLRRRDWPP